MTEEQEEEIQALKAIYDADFADIKRQPPCFMIKLSNMDVELRSPVWLRFTLPPDYPAVPPSIEVPMHSQVLSPEQCTKLLNHLSEQAGDLVGMAMVFTLVEVAQTWIGEHIQPGMDESVESAVDADTEEEEGELPSIVDRPVEDTKATGGRWQFVVGLVGKPSAGKSTFFNAAVGKDLAKTGAFPFTTIEPNVKQALYAVFCPCQRMEKQCDSAFGHSADGKRLMPLILKDVAGLVPGAYEGKGRGNRFLNDLLDADVLIHVVDASGCTDEKGEVTEKYDPSQDISWVERELQQWIYQNVMEKWDAIRRRPQKLVDMFTGYHATRSTIVQALTSAGVGETELNNLPQWGEEVLRRIVAQFVRVRFPILLALNKADLPTAAEHIEKISQLGHPCTAVSALSERFLQSCEEKGELVQKAETEDVTPVTQCNEETRQRLASIQDSVIKRFGGTNVQGALSAAVELKQPVYAYPVSNLSTLKSLSSGGSSHQHGREPRMLHDCVPLKPGTTVVQFFELLCHYPFRLLSGDFVRAEMLDELGNERHMKKEEILPKPYCIIKYMSTKRGAAV
ncbi:hypothetical protein BaRGS_00027753 [Batillaria attramentaria]|uniref:RWD domain-containing protein n=1 Tax=Batillaria attramentaria TaxID=370345 RepID=A0ABD0K1W3_9CAEN